LNLNFERHIHDFTRSHGFDPTLSNGPRGHGLKDLENFGEIQWSKIFWTC